MKTPLQRREFLKKSYQAGIACCTLLYASKLNLLGNQGSFPGIDIPDPKKLNYCGYTCPADCKMKKATLENDVALKQEAYKNWRIEEKYGISFDPDKVFCFGCKTPDKPVGLVVEKCTVRNCAREKGYDCCIQCDKLSDCDKEIWNTFPDFHLTVIEMQKKYKDAAKP
jgi:hypothetical protein